MTTHELGDTVYWLDESRGWIDCRHGRIVGLSRRVAVVWVEGEESGEFAFPCPKSLLTTREQQREAFDRRIAELRRQGK